MTKRSAADNPACAFLFMDDAVLYAPEVAPVVRSLLVFETSAADGTSEPCARAVAGSTEEIRSMINTNPKTLAGLALVDK